MKPFTPRNLQAALAAILACTQVLADAPAGDGTTSHLSRTLKELGKGYSMNLKGVEASDSVNFDVRADELVTGAQLTLDYSYSPSLLADLSQINVLVNDQVASTLPLPKAQAGIPQRQVVQIAPHLITEFNRLSLQFIGHYTMQCEDPLHSSLWARISNDSQLDLTLTPIDQPNDLANWPLPFFDRRDARSLNLPFVFASAPDNATLEAAGTLSSWFGAQAGYRGARFTAHLAQLPAHGNAVVFVSARQAQTVAGLNLPAPQGPTVTVLTHPNDPLAKLLIVAGRDSAELKVAANALALGGASLAGQSVTIGRVDALKPRRPYDAPNWLPSDRPVRLGELAPVEQLNVGGYNPGQITVPLRLPPDLFNWRENGATLNLKYRYTPQPVATNSSLLVSFNDTFIQSMPLPSMDKLGAANTVMAALKTDDSLSRESHVVLPLNAVALQSRLQFRFMYDYIKQGDCRDIIIDNMRGVIDPDSTLDLSQFDHYMAMPNLGVFKDSGFPFTRLADLSETAVVLPDTPGPAELGAYLTVLGRFGESTGYPATGVSVVNADQLATLHDKDLLVLATENDQPLLAQWQRFMPVALEGDERYFELSDLPLRMRDWLSPDPRANVREARNSLSYSSTDQGAYLTGFQSPLQPGRSVVVLGSAQPSGLAQATEALLDTRESAHQIQGSLVVIKGQHVESLVAEQDYYVGSLSPWRWVQWHLSQSLLSMLLATAGAVALLAGSAYLALRAQAKRRLAE